MLPSDKGSLKAWLSWIESQHPVAMELTLGRVTQVANRLNLLTSQCPVITVGGTNGKGSCCALLEAILLAAKMKVGVYTSPHLLVYNERVKINGVIVADDGWCDAFQQIAKAAQGITLTYFEYSTLAALYLFQQAKLDLIVLEVGLGGRLDAVNLIDTDVAVITTIDLDHQQWLGDTREEIGYEKAGIFRSHKPAICGDSNPPESIFKAALTQKAKLFYKGVDFNYQTHSTHWDWFSHNKDYRGLPLPAIHLQNAASAIMALACLPQFNFSKEMMAKGLTQINQLGRQQYVQGAPSHLFDVAHNPQSTLHLSHYVTTLKNKHQYIHAVVAMLEDKDILASLKPLKPLIDNWSIAGLDVARGAKVEVMQKAMEELEIKPYQAFMTVGNAYHHAIKQTADTGLIVIFGSFHTVAAVMSLS